MGIPSMGLTVNEIHSGLQSIQQARYAMAGMLCIQIYEWFAGFKKEIELIHRAPWSSIKVAYLLCRYYPLALWILVLWAYVGDHTFEVCTRVAHPVHALLAPCQFFSQAVMVMRAYAFTGRSQRVKYLLGFCFLCLLCVDLWVFCSPIEGMPKLFYLVLGDSGCYPNYGGGFMGLRIGYSMLAATLMDLISLLVMVIHSQRNTGYHSVSLGRYFISQGFGAFVFVCIVNVATAIAFFRPPRFHDGIGLPMILIVSNVVACRIILQLRKKCIPPTNTEIARHHSAIVRRAFTPLITKEDDNWIIEV